MQSHSLLAARGLIFTDAIHEEGMDSPSVLVPLVDLAAEEGSSFLNSPVANIASNVELREWKILGMEPWVFAVTFSVMASGLTVSGSVLQKKAQAESVGHHVVGDFVLSPKWFLGCLLMVLAACKDALAFALAPSSLIAPLSGISVALNMVFAPYLLGERTQFFPDAPATGLIIAGVGLTTFVGAHQEPDFDVPALLKLFWQPAFLLALSGLVALVVVCLLMMHVWGQDIEEASEKRRTNPNIFHLLLPAVVAVAFGGISQIFLKGFGELCRVGAPKIQCILCVVFGVAPCAALQLNFLNRGLRLYYQTIFFPIYSALLVLAATFYGGLFWGEYAVLLQQNGRCSLYALGVLLNLLGVGLFAFRSAEGDGLKCGKGECIS